MRKIALTGKNGAGKCAIVDDDDYEKYGHLKWVYNANGYAARHGKRSGGKRPLYLLHRLIIDAPKDSFVDHANRDPLDNRRENLRLCTRSQNMLNRSKWGITSKYKGVTKYRGKWRAQTKVNGEQKWLGDFEVEEDAARAYDEAAAKFHGIFALKNFS